MKHKPERRPRAGPPRDEQEVARFVERFALLVNQSGLERMPARVFVALLTTDAGYLTAAQIADNLRVSRAAISIAMKYLVRVGLVTRERQPGERVDRYRIDSETWFESFTRRDEMLAAWENCIRDGVVSLGPGSPAGERLEETRLFMEFMRLESPRLIERWRKHRDRVREQRRKK